jgi:hypothetical protein
MAKGDKKNTKAFNMGMAFLLTLTVVGVEVWAVFRNQWDLFEALMTENPFFVMVLFGAQLSIPMLAGYLAAEGAGKKVGDEAENIARGLRP